MNFQCTKQCISTLSLCRFSLAFIWIYQGLVPKWLGPHEDELAMNMALGFDAAQAVWVSYIGGTLEVLLGLAILGFHRHRWPYWASAITITLLFVFTLIYMPQLLLAAFNPTTVNLAMAALSIIGLVELHRLQAKY